MVENNILEIKNLNYRKDEYDYLKDFKMEVENKSIHSVLFQNEESKNKLLEFIRGESKTAQGRLIFKDREIGQEKLQKLKKETIYFINRYSALNPEKDPLGIFKFNKKGEKENRSTVFPEMTVAENIFFGREPLKKFLFFKSIDNQKMFEETLKLLGLLDVEIYPKQKMLELSPLKKQLVELLKALSLGAELIIIDQAVVELNARDKEIFFSFMQELKQKDFTIIYFTKEIEEVFNTSDTVTVLKDGRNNGTQKVANLEYNQLALMLMGR
ncbi:ATP-binding cassette domain-containing protein [Halanaerobium kushneri]|uniref:Inositol transport system ATP-binding protein n=1 Tax=Halanaerobium kushneri TaxID=56779 RepID=A0A1N6SCX0_9FIRM|nr:ATP-binding cassette domain-containing protein [Halanaerobium kushneri]SIQ38889.1 inositol transport system ATP-binding protein [Halanaerobium kushneri]